MHPVTRTRDQETDSFLVLDALVSKFYEAEPQVKIEVDFGAASHRGKVRELNEDHYLVVRRCRSRELVLTNLPEGLLEENSDEAYTMAVADGLGGHSHGDLASLMALQAGWYFGSNEIKWTHKINEAETEELKKKAEVFFHLVNRTMQIEGMAEPRLLHMGTTLTISYSTGNRLFIVHVGDTRVYRHRKHRLEQLTHDHTVAQHMIDAGLITKDSPEARKSRHLLTSSLGKKGNLSEIDFSQHIIADGDQILLCSDGLTDMATDVEINDVLNQNLPPDQSASRLLDLAMENGGRDNITVVIARYTYKARSDGSSNTPPQSS